MGERMNWKKRIEKSEEISNIDFNYCFLNDTGHGDFVLDKFAFNKESGLFWFDKEGGKAYRDSDAFSAVQYQYYKIFLSKKMPNDKFEMQKTGSTLELLYNNKLTLSCDYIGPIKKSYYIHNKCNIKRLANLLLNTRNFAGSMVWPNTKKGKNLTVNQAKGFLLKDRMDLTLINLQAYMDSGYDVSACSCRQLGQAFEDHKGWYNHFKSFQQFIDFFCLGDFVSGNKVISFDSYDAYLGGIEKMIMNRKMRLKQTWNGLMSEQTKQH